MGGKALAEVDVPDAEGVGDGGEHLNRNVGALLEGREMPAADPCGLRKLLLRQTLPVPRLPDRDPIELCHGRAPPSFQQAGSVANG